MEPMKPWRFSLRQLLLGMIAFGIATIYGREILVAIWGARDSALRMQEMNNAKQVSLGLLYHHDAEKTFPPSRTYDAAGKPYLSWRTAIVPYLEAIHFPYDKMQAWNSPKNDVLCRSLGRWFRSPDAKNSDPACTNIVMPTGPHTVGQGVSLADVTDDHATTILFLSLKPSDILWHEPRDLDVSEITRADGDPQRIVIRGQLFTGGIAAMVDGSVRRLPEDLSYDDLMAMLTIDGGEKVDASWLRREKR